MTQAVRSTVHLESVNHDAAPGPLTRCQICGSEDLRQIIDLGHQPPCAALLSAQQLNEPEITYPLRLNQCEECSLAQLDYVVPATKIYPINYPYRAGVSWPVVAAHKAMAESLVQRFGVGLCVDIGSNDGTLLAQFRDLGCDVMGVEPTDIARIARANRIPTIQNFFSEAVACSIFANHGPVHICTMTNVFAHMADLGECMRGVCAMMAEDGVLVIENHYLLDVLDGNQFDTIYHEHVRTYSLKALVRLFEQYGLKVFDVDRVPRYGGNIRAYVAKAGTRPVGSKVGELLAVEAMRGLGRGDTWARFRRCVFDARFELMTFLQCNRGHVAACSAPGRASTLLNFFGVTPDLLPWTGELDGSLKLGKYIPGCHVPIVHNRRLAEEQPEYVVLLAWHYAAEVASRLRREGVRAKLFAPLPRFAEV